MSLEEPDCSPRRKRWHS